MKYDFNKSMPFNFKSLELQPFYCKGFIPEDTRIKTELMGSKPVLVLQIHEKDYNPYLLPDRSFTTLRSALIYNRLEVRFTMSVTTEHDMDVFWIRDCADADLESEDCMGVTIKNKVLSIDDVSVKTIQIEEPFEVACLIEQHKITILCGDKKKSIIKNFNRQKWFHIGCKAQRGQWNRVNLHNFSYT